MRLSSLAAAATGPLVVVAVIAASAASACTTDYQKGLEDPAYGGPNSLEGQKQPGPSSDNVIGEAGTSGGGGTDPKCVAAGGTVVDGGACAVSFKTDVLGIFKNAAVPCAQSTSCHGGDNPIYQPKINPDDAPGTWAAFAAFTLSDGKLLINPCSTDDTQSGLACDLYAAGQAGACGVHMPQGGQLTDDDIEKITTWLKCGSPNN